MEEIDLCVPCIALVGAGPYIDPHPELRRVQRPSEVKLFNCGTCDAWWSIQELGWGRLISP